MLEEFHPEEQSGDAPEDALRGQGPRVSGLQKEVHDEKQTGLAFEEA